MSKIFNAIKKVDIKTIESLVKNNPELLNEQNHHGLLPLHYAAKCGDTEIIEQLINLGANPNSRNANNETPLFLASTVEVAETLVANGADPNAKCGSHYPSDSVSSAKVRDFLLYVLKAKSVENEDWNDDDDDIDDDDDFDYGDLDPNLYHFAEDEDEEEHPTLHKSLYKSSSGKEFREIWEAIEIWAECVALSKSEDTKTAGQALRERKKEALQRKDETLSFILSRLDEVSRDGGIEGITRWQDKQGHTLAYHAIFHRCNQVLEFLFMEMENYLYLHSEDNWGRQPLHWAAACGNLEAAIILVKAGARIGVTDNTRQTPLHLAVANEHYNVALYLIEKGANGRTKNTDGQTPFDLLKSRFKDIPETETLTQFLRLLIGETAWKEVEAAVDE